MYIYTLSCHHLELFISVLGNLISIVGMNSSAFACLRRYLSLHPKDSFPERVFLTENLLCSGNLTMSFPSILACTFTSEKSAEGNERSGNRQVRI